MIPLEECIALLLCGGLSKRFGPENKLLASLSGKPLAAHAAQLCTRVPFSRRIAVVPPAAPSLERILRGYGLDLVVNPAPEKGKESSLRIGLAAALALRGRGIVVLLGDMPHVGTEQLRALSGAADDNTASISVAREVASPPILIPAAPAKRAIAAVDQPVRVSLGRLVHVEASSSMLVDYDLPEHFLEGSLLSRCSTEDR